MGNGTNIFKRFIQLPQTLSRANQSVDQTLDATDNLEQKSQESLAGSAELAHKLSGETPAQIAPDTTTFRFDTSQGEALPFLPDLSFMDEDQSEK